MEGKCGCIHAERNLIKKMSERDIERANTVLITHSPCETCGWYLYQNLPNLQRVFYKHEYRKTDGIEYLRLKGLDVQQVEWRGNTVTFEDHKTQ